MAQWPSPRPTGRRPERPLPPPSVQTQVHPSCSPTAFTATVAVMAAVTATATAITALPPTAALSSVHNFPSQIFPATPNCPQPYLTDQCRLQGQAAGWRSRGSEWQSWVPRSPHPCQEMQPAQQRGGQRNPEVLIPVPLPPLTVHIGACKLSLQRASQ